VFVVVDEGSAREEGGDFGGQILRDCERERALVSEISSAFADTWRSMDRC